MKVKRFLILYFSLIVFSGSAMASDDAVRGWIILSDHMENAIETIKAAKDYNINHLQLSHQIVHDLREVKEEKVRDHVNKLVGLAHSEGIVNCRSLIKRDKVVLMIKETAHDFFIEIGFSEWIISNFNIYKNEIVV